MSRYVASLELVPRVAAGETAAIARLMSRAEAGLEEARPALAEIYRRAGGAHVIGITGVPGSGKSTLVARLARMLRDGACEKRRRSRLKPDQALAPRRCNGIDPANSRAQTQ
jgi:putative protein kinase ArgK-like GTPase of G3E family